MSAYPCPQCGALSDNCTTTTNRNHPERRHIDADVEAMRELVASYDVGFREVGSRTHHYIWVSETEKRRLTAREMRALRALLDAREARYVHAVGARSRGYAELYRPAVTAAPTVDGA